MTQATAIADSPRERLLDAVVEYALTEGLSDRSLRAIARALGTSHRMLIFHFGSREELFVEVVREVERRQRQYLDELQSTPGIDLQAAGRMLWDRLRDPSLHAQERLFFEVYGQALQGREWARGMLDGIVDDWTRPVQAMLEHYGVDPRSARADARLGLAVTRGLLLDLLATGDAAGVDEAMIRFEQLMGPELPGGLPPPAG